MAAYTITLTDGTFVTLVPDLTVNTTATPLSLFGHGLVEYGAALDENFIYLLENFSDGTAPNTPLIGQLWYNKLEDVLYLRSVTNTWVPIQTQINPVYSEITVLDGNGNSAELDGTGNLYLQTSNPAISFLTTYADPLSNGHVVASITLNSSGVLQIQPGLNVIGNEVIQGSLDISGSSTTASLLVINGTNTKTLSVSETASITGNTTIGGTLAVGSTVTSGAITSSGNVVAATGSNSAALQDGGILYLIRTNATDYAEIDFDDGTGLQGRIKLKNVGIGAADGNWNTGAPTWPSGANNPYALIIENALAVLGNAYIEGNLTVGGTITSANSGNYVPITGGTMTGDLDMNNCNITIENTVDPVLTLNGTSSSSKASLVMEIDNFSGSLNALVNEGGSNVMNFSVYGGAGMFAIDFTNNLIAHYAQTVMDNSLSIFLDGTQPCLSVYSHSAGGPYTPSIMLCDPGASGHTPGADSWAMGMSLHGTDNNPNNYTLQFGNFNGNNSTITTVLMSMDYQGNVSATSFTPTSDPKFKENIIPLENHVAKRLLLTPTFRYNLKDEDDRTHFGIVADEKFEKLWPELVYRQTKIIEGEATEVKSVNYNGFIAPLIELIKSHEKRIAELEAKLIEFVK